MGKKCISFMLSVLLFSVSFQFINICYEGTEILKAAVAAKETLRFNEPDKSEPEEESKNENGAPKGGLNLPNASGEITSVPWENDEKFKKAQEKYDTNVMMAGYCTVLHDPLPGEEENVHLAADYLAGTIVKPGEVFSQNLKIGPYTQSRGFKKGPTYLGTQLITTIGGGVCKIASTLYNVTILSNLKVVERHSHSMPVPYVPYGQDATVSYGTRDFKFLNNTDHNILIWSKGIDNVLYIGFYSDKRPPMVEWHHETLRIEKAPKYYRINSKLPKGSEKLILEGMDGALVKSWLTIEDSDGIIKVRELGNSYYRPMPHIYEINK